MDYNVINGNRVKDMIIYLNSQCNLKCKHCFLSQEEPPKQLSERDLRWIKDTFEIKNTMLIGGEPLLYPFLDYAINLFDRVTISTNGLLLASDSPKVSEFIRLFKQKKDMISIQLSIEGNKEDTDTIRGMGVWEKVINAASLLKKNNIKCYFRCSYNEQNLQHIPEIIDDVSHVLDIPLVLFPMIGDSPLPADKQIWLFNLIMEKNKEYNEHNLIAQPHFLQWLGEEGRCEAGSERLCITYNKEIIPCHFDFNYNLGHIGNNINTINSVRESFLKMAKRIQPSCDFCKNAEVCRSSCYMADSHAGCPLKERFTIEHFMHLHDIKEGELTTQILDIKELMKESLIC